MIKDSTKNSAKKLYFLFPIIFVILSSCEIGLGSAVDTEAPEAAISSPSVGVIIRDSFEIGGSWSDDGEIKSVTVSLSSTDGRGGSASYSAEVSTEESGSGSWKCSVNPEEDGLPDGSYEASVSISDKAGHVTSITRTFAVDNTAPVIVLQRPATVSSSSESADSYGQTFTLEGQAADDNNVSLIEVYIYGEEECSTLLHTIQLQNVPNTINLDVAKFVEGDTEEDSEGYNYYKIYGSAEKNGEKELYCKIKAYDGAQRYPEDGNQSAEDTYGNSTESYYLYEDVASYISEYKITGLYSMKNGTYGSDDSSRSAAESVLEELESLEASEGKFSLNPENNPTFTVAGYSQLAGDGSDFSDGENDITNGSSVVIEVSPGLDAIPLESEGLCVYAIECDENGSISGSEKVYPSTGSATKSGTNYKFIATVNRRDGFDFGSYYRWGVEGSDQNGNEVSGSGNGYGFRFVSSGSAPNLVVSTPSSGTVYQTLGSSVSVSGSVTYEDSGTFSIVLSDEDGEEVVNVSASADNGVSQTSAASGGVLSYIITDSENNKYEYLYVIPSSAFSQEEDGQYKLTVSAESGGKSSVERTIVYDVEGPNITFTSPSTAKYYADESGEDDGNEYLNGSVSLGITITDSYDTVNVSTNPPVVSYSRGQESETITSLPTGYVTLDTESIGDGDLTVSVKAYDRAGNVSTATKSFKIKHETDNPVIIPNDSSSVSFTEFSTNTSVSPASQEAESAKNWFTSGDALELRLIDDDGLSSCKIERSGKYTYEDSSFDYDESEEITEGELEEQESYSLNGSKDVSKSFKGMPEEPGYYKFKITATDLNSLSTTKEFWVRITAAAPIVSAQADKTYITTNSTRLESGAATSITMTVTISSDQKPFTIYRYVKSASGNEISADSSDSGNPLATGVTESIYTDSFSPSGSYSTGSYIISYKVVDTNGKSGTSGSFTFKVDNDLPVISSVSYPSVSESEGVSYSFKTSASDTGGSSTYPEKYYIAFGAGSGSAPEDISGYTETTSSHTLVFANSSVFATEGSKNVYVIVSDSVGNLSDAYSQSFTYDSASPEVAVSGYTEEGGSFVSCSSDFDIGKAFSLSGSASDGYGIASIVISQSYAGGDSETIQTITEPEEESWSVSGLPRKVGSTSESELLTGEYKYVISVTDKAGKESSTAITVSIDVSAPTVSVTSPSPAGGEIVSGSSVSISGKAVDSGDVTTGQRNLYYAISTSSTAPTAEVSDTSVWTSVALSSTNWSFTKSLGSGVSGSEYDLYEGSYYLHVKADDNAGNLSDATSVQFYVDQGAPVISGISGSADGSTAVSLSTSGVNYYKPESSGSYTISGSVVESYGLESLSVGGNSLASLPEASTEAQSWSYTLGSVSADTEVSVSIEAVDKAGQSSSKSVVIYADSTAPSLEITAPESDISGDDSLASSSYTFRSTATDDGSSVSEIKYIFSQSEISDIAADAESGSGWTSASGKTGFSQSMTLNSGTSEGDGSISSGSGALCEGQWYLYVYAADSVGNVSTAARSFFVDKSSPSVTTSVNGSAVSTSSEMSVKELSSFVISLSDTNGMDSSEPYSLSVTKDGSAFSSYSVSTVTEGSEYSVSLSSSEDGLYCFTVTGKDLAGKTSEVTRNIRIDSTAPVVSVTSPDFTAWQKINTVTVGGSASDATGVSAVYVNLDGGSSLSVPASDTTESASWTAMDPAWTAASGSGSWYATLSVEDGSSHTVSVAAVDTLGNVTEITTKTLKVDASQASVESLYYQVGSGSLTSASGSVYVNGSLGVTVYGSVSDETSGLDSLVFSIAGSTKTPESILYSTESLDSVSAEGVSGLTYSAYSSDNATEIKYWKAVFDGSSMASGSFNVKASDIAGNTTSKNAFTVVFDTTVPGFANLSVSSSYQADSSRYEYYVNNKSTTTISGTASDNTGVSSVNLAISTISYSESVTSSPTVWSFTGIDLTDCADKAEVAATLTITDLAGNVTTEEITLTMDKSGPVAYHQADKKGKDIYFRIGDSDNDLSELQSWTSTITALDDDLDTDVGGKYSYGTYGNTSVITVSGNINDGSGSGVKLIYYKVYTEAPDSTDINDFLSNPDSLKTGSFEPLSSSETKRVKYTNESGYEFKNVATTYRSTISGLTSTNNYVVLAAVDNVGNAACDTLCIKNADSEDGSTYGISGSDYAYWNGGDSSTSTSGKAYYSLNYDYVAPNLTTDISSIQYTNKSGIMTLTGSAEDSLSGISDLSISVNGNTIELGDTETVDGEEITLLSLDSSTNVWTAKLVCSEVFSSLASGNVDIVYLNASDKAGNSASVAAATVTIDTTSPVINLTTSPSSTVNKTITIAGSATDSGAGLRTDGSNEKTLSLYYKQSDTAITSVSSVDGWTVYGTLSHASSWSFEVDTETLTDKKTYYFTVEAYDAAGNAGYMSPLKVYVKQDSDRPVITFTNLTISSMSSSNYVWLKNTTSLLGIVSDDDGISSMSYSTDAGSSWTAVTVNNGSWTISLSEGSSVVYFKVTDSESGEFVSEASASNSLTTPKLSDGSNSITSGIPVYIKVDKTSPVTANQKYAYYDTSLSTPAYTSLSGSLATVGGKRTKVKVNLDAGDENGIESVSVSLGGNTYSGSKESSESEASDDGKYYSNWTVSDIDVSGLTTGNQYATLTVTDTAGLTKTDTIVITVDNTDSEVSVKSPSSSTSVSGEVSAYGTLTETATLYYSVSPSASDPDTVTSVSSWTDGDGSSHSMTAKTVDGWTEVEDASLSWTVNFNNITDGSASGTNTKSLNAYIIAYGIAAQDTSGSAEDAIVSSFETIVKLYLHLKTVDAVGNEYTYSYPILVDPQGDRPSVAFSYPAENEVTLGGKVTIYGTASDTAGTTIGVDSVWVQLKSTTHRAAENTTTYGTSPSYDEDEDSVSMTMTTADLDYMAANGYSVYKMSSYDLDGTNTAWTSGSSSLGDGESASDYAALATLSGAAWNISINKTSDSGTGLNEFDPPSGTSSNPLAIRVYARDYDGKLSQKAERYVSFDADTPVISDLYLVQSSDEKLATESTASKAYTQDMYVKGAWYITGTATDKDKIAELTIGDVTLVTGSAVVTTYSDCVSLSSDKTTVTFKYPLSTSSGVGSLSLVISAVDAAEGTSHTGSETLAINYDNTAPVIADSTASAFNIDSDICQSDGWYTFGSAAYEAAAADGSAQSGFAYTAFFFQRTYSSVNNIYDILKAKASAAISLGSSTISALGEESNSSADNTIVSDSGLYWYRKAITANSISGSTFTVSDTTGIRVNALMKISGSLYLVTAVNGTSVTVDNTLPEDAELAYVAIAGIVDNTTPESAPSTGSVEDDGYYASPSRDDGDRMIESVDKSGTTWTWEANVCSRNIADGPVTLYYVVFDKAGNYTVGSVSGTISNNRPRIAGAIVQTDYNGDGDVTDDGETISSYAASASYATYYTGTTSSGAYIYDPDEYVVNTNSKKELPTSETYGSATSPLAALHGYTVIKPEIVGGNGALYYEYSVVNGDTTTSGQNATAFISEGSTDYTAVTGSINVQLGDLLKFGDTSSDTTGIPFTFTFWDETEGTTAFTDSQSASLTMYFAVRAATVGSPSASITPFYWNSSSDNSLYGNSSANGHIELEGDLPTETFTSSGSGIYDLDPKVSGKVTITGTATDTKLIALLKASIFDTEYQVATYSSTSGLLASNYIVDNFETNGFWFELVSQTINESGHTANWKLHLDTEVLTSASADLTVTMVTTNFGKPSVSESETSTDYLSIDGSTYYSGTLSYESVASSTPGTSQTSSTTQTAYYKMDVVPYITSITTSARNYGGLKNYNIRSSSGKYSILANNASNIIEVTGFNFSTTSLTGRIVDSASLVSATSSSGNELTVSVSDVNNITITNSSITASGYLELFSNGIRTLNNINNNDSNGKYSVTGVTKTDAPNLYNREPDTENNTKNYILTDDRYIRFFDMHQTGVKNGYYPTMIMNDDNPVFGYVDLTGGESGSATDTGTDSYAGSYYPSHAMPQRSEYSFTSGTTAATKVYTEYLIKASIWDQMGMAVDEGGRYYNVSVYNRDGCAMSLIYDRYAELYQNALGWGAGTGYSGYNGNWSYGTGNNAITLERTDYNDSLLLNRYQYPKLIAKGNSKTGTAYIYMAYYDDNTGELLFRNFQIGTSVSGTATALDSKHSDIYETVYNQYYNFTENTGNSDDWSTGRISVASGASKHFAMGVTDDYHVVIAYYDETEGKLILKYSTDAIKGASPTADIDWTTSSVSMPSYVGTYMSMAIDGSSVHISALDSSDSDLVYLYMPTYNGSTIQTIRIDQAFAVGQWTQIKVYNSVPYIAYYNSTETGSRDSIKLAYYNSTIEAGSTATVNPGVDSDGYTSGYWEYMTVPAITPPQGGDSKFQNVCLDFDSSGNPIIGYLGTYIEFGKSLSE